ncbi:hypothetical protein [Streptacidiphilus fuscans]|uniref:Uncharacterized protein n=1 Tax=Streptacidiphilus fuscans TaxID=2789292 RepID=A0A931B726_9ACTN|nr:hypothetical protein [Streptacidiphilus fuscans]MBF9071619.1 hypothetical protein [Streptacidiphilus fuscans]MBF9072894.1 hypothetical protein [Streptacidiphilus fuscans]
MAMELNHHRKVRIRVGSVRRAVRFGLLVTAGLGTLGATTGVAQAVGPNGGALDGTAVRGVAVADDGAFTLATRAHESRFQDSFTVHQFGAVYSATADNQATAYTSWCSADDPCRSVSLSFQIVTMAGTDIHLDAHNRSTAANVHCPGCESLAGAYQFIVSTPRPFTLGVSAQRQFAEIHRKLDALGRSSAPVAEVRQQADALAAQVTALLRAAAATAPKGPGVNALAELEPQVTVHRVWA